jgi:hypothetical protein
MSALSRGFARRYKATREITYSFHRQPNLWDAQHSCQRSDVIGFAHSAL